MTRYERRKLTKLCADGFTLAEIGNAFGYTEAWASKIVRRLAIKRPNGYAIRTVRACRGR